MNPETMPPELAAILRALDAADLDARALATGVDEMTGTWRAAPGSWSIAECLDHLAVANRVYVAAMRPSADAALMRRRMRRRPALPGLIGGWFVRSLEPPVRPKRKLRAPRKIRPRSGPTLADALGALLASHDEVRAFIAQYRDIDLAAVTFPNPFIRGLRFSLATGLHVIPAHNRRHLLQARNVKAAALAAHAA